MKKRYQPEKTENKIYQMWEEGGYFKPEIDKSKEPFVITLPPPNVTGGLHAGHALYILEDIMIRYHRMKGDATLWVPGFDHASIAVEYLVTQQLAKEGKTKQDIGREEFLKRAHNFANQSKKYIRNQLKRLGFSLDWSREAYTMDKERSRAVEEAFHRLYKKGLIYKGNYIINWCPNCQTALSDLENEHKQEKGTLYYIKYGPITIATTRPETMFADVAVAVHPQDNRYQDMVGEQVPLPLTTRKLPVITDTLVDPEFGTGALKITPAHDETDFNIGKKHNLETLKVIDKEGLLTDLAEKFAGLTVAEGRKQVVEALKEKELLIKEEPVQHNIGHCQRCGTRTEPLISKQWFVKIKPLAEKALKAVREGKVQIVPEMYKKVFFHWMENIHDWCISRQLWWGHKIPLEGETDILDTWFSSALWPMSVFGWPESTKDLQYFYPNTVRETGHDILFFWVAREIMMCMEMSNEVPFETVYLHGLVRDNQGRKFSKTKGIGFDPLEMVETYGTDALRMALIIGNAPGTDLKINEDKVRSYRNFANKIWNIGRFIYSNLEKNNWLEWQDIPKLDIAHTKLTNKDKKIIKEWHNTLEYVTKNIDHQNHNYRFDLAGKELYQFIWHEFADKYIEYSKEDLYSNSEKKKKGKLTILRYIYYNTLKALHPFMPFVTEEIWQRLPHQKYKPLIVTTWPNPIKS
ncbi:MAG: valine--tRNA ligase [Patescibacteria group bacterium]|nr:valine--tRNA ligase [Patescibacteria group bacterium]